MLFQTDYLISWDFSKEDFLIISVTRLRAEENSTHVIADVIDVTHEKCGVMSLRQLLEGYERRKAAEGGGSAYDNN